MSELTGYQASHGAGVKSALKESQGMRPCSLLACVANAARMHRRWMLSSHSTDPARDEPDLSAGRRCQGQHGAGIGA